MTVVLAAVMPAAGARPVYGSEASHARLRVVLDKRTVEMDPAPAYIDRQPYLPLRAVCEALGGRARWNAALSQASVLFQQKNHLVDGVIIDDRLMVSPAQIAEIFDVYAQYDAALSAVILDHGSPPSQPQLISILPEYQGYSGEDLYWLSRIVEAEATGESFESRLAVANVIINRLNHPEYPDTIREVIFDKKHGTQFTPVSNGSVYNEPSTQSYLAALDALEGRNNALGALFFMNPQYATSFWMQNNRQYAFTIGGHQYYY